MLHILIQLQISIAWLFIFMLRCRRWTYYIFWLLPQYVVQQIWTMKYLHILLWKINQFLFFADWECLINIQWSTECKPTPISLIFHFRFQIMCIRYSLHWSYKKRSSLNIREMHKARNKVFSYLWLAFTWISVSNHRHQALNIACDPNHTISLCFFFFLVAVSFAVIGIIDYVN